LQPSENLVIPVESILNVETWGYANGILRIATDLPKLSVAGFRERYNTREPAPDFLFTSIPLVVETGAPLQRLAFPYLANGEGVKAQIILFSGTAGETSQGQLLFTRPDGTPLMLDIE
jgi:hypothetical protein